jgi:hypothetical protein
MDNVHQREKDEEEEEEEDEEDSDVDVVGLSDENEDDAMEFSVGSGSTDGGDSGVPLSPRTPPPPPPPSSTGSGGEEDSVEMFDEEGLRQQQREEEEKITLPVPVPINPYGDSHTREEDERQIQQYLDAVEVRVLVNRMRLITSRISRRAAERKNDTTTTTTM